MNIFYLHDNPQKAALMHADGHINKMISESAQMLSTALRVTISPKPIKVYKLNKHGEYRIKSLHVVPTDSFESGKSDFMPILRSYELMLNTHENHPCNKWARESMSNFTWLSMLLSELHDVWTINMAKAPHASYTNLQTQIKKLSVNSIPHGVFTKPALAMPLHFYRADRVEAYRAYYQAKLSGWIAEPSKVRYAQYTNRPVPTWLNLEQ